VSLASASVIANAAAHVLALTAFPCRLVDKQENYTNKKQTRNGNFMSYMNAFTLPAKVSSCCAVVASGSGGAPPPGGVFCVVYGLLTSMRLSSSEIEQFVPLKMETASEGPARGPLVDRESWTPTLQRSSNKRDSNPA